MIEQWKTVPGYEGRYEASSLGRVRSLIDKNGIPREPHEIKQFFDKNKMVGRYKVFLYKPVSDGRQHRRTWPTHRVVALTFVPNPDKLPEVNHIDGNKLNNQADNLEWMTRLENRRHADRLGLYTYRKGNEVYNAKLTPEKVRYARENPDNLVQRALAKDLGVSQATLADAISGRSWSHVQ